MPIYEYKCSSCGKTMEIMQKFSDKPFTKCPSCSGKLAKLISNCSFHLKGSGWYVTDYKKNGTSKKEKESDSKKTEEAPKNEVVASKPEAKAEEKKV